MSGVDDRLKGSEARLWALIDERLAPGADKRSIDQRIWDLFGEDWAVMFTDLSGFSRRVAEFGIIHFLQVLYEQKRLLSPVVHDHDGILIKIEADSLLVIFKKPRRALECAIAMQHACQKLSLQRTPEEKLLLCIGLGVGRILRIGDVDVYGAEVNAASKLGEDTAKASEILVTRAFREQCGEVPGVVFHEIDVTIPGTDKSYNVQYDHYGAKP
jgi:class 3 adenylate cyclase